MKIRKEKLVSLLAKHPRILLSTHVHPDGDGLGAQLAFHRYLLQLGRHAVVVNPGATPEKFAFLDPEGSVQVYGPEFALPEIDLVLIFDTNELKMLGDLGPALKSLGVPIVFLDHHITEEEPGMLYFTRTEASSTGEVIHDFLEWAGVQLSQPMALSLYTAVAFDSEHFRRDQNVVRTHRLAAKLLGSGISAEHVHHQLYGRVSFAKMRLMGQVLSQVQHSDDQRIAWITVTLQNRLRHGATIEDTESFITQMLLLETVDIGIVFREEENGKIKVSMRGREIPVIDISLKLGGGGHRFASGTRLVGPLDRAIHIVLSEARELLARYPRRKVA